MKRYYKDIELLHIAKNCKDHDELKRVSETLLMLYEIGLFINIKLFLVFAGKRLREIHKTQ